MDTKLAKLNGFFVMKLSLYYYSILTCCALKELALRQHRPTITSLYTQTTTRAIASLVDYYCKWLFYIGSSFRSSFIKGTNYHHITHRKPAAVLTIISSICDGARCTFTFTYYVLGNRTYFRIFTI